jgi:hypothetical protein
MNGYSSSRARAHSFYDESYPSEAIENVIRNQILFDYLSFEPCSEPPSPLGFSLRWDLSFTATG